MKSGTLPSFWDAYARLGLEERERARKAYRLWAESQFHPSLHFKCVNVREHVWSLRISRSIRALGVFEGEGVTWFWIGSHGDYDKMLG